MRTRNIAIAAALAAAGSVFADTHNVADGATDTLSGVTETSRFTKTGGGTLVLSGVNSLDTVTVSAGTLNIHGGTTTISGSGQGSGNDAAYDGAAFVNKGGQAVVIDGGATVTMTGGSYMHTDSGVFVVSNATFNVQNTEAMNGFHGGSTGAYASSRFIIGEGGVVNANKLRPTGGNSRETTKENFSIDLNAGGNLYVNQFWVDGNSRWGRINFNGGILHATQEGLRDKPGNQLFNEANSRTSWTASQTTPTVLACGAYIDWTQENTIYPAFKSGVAEGETDGGIHHRGNKVIYWRAADSTYNGGTWLESTGGGVLAVNADYDESVLGAVPATPATNIWATGSNHTLFNEWGTFTTHPNRMVFIKDQCAFKVGAQSSARLVIGGEIKGEITAGNTDPLGTYLEARANWAGTSVLDPGEGHTNDVGKLVVGGHLEIASGVTRLTSGQNLMTATLAPLYVLGGDSYSTGKGNLTISGGELYIPQSSRYLDISKRAQVNVVGGKLNAPGSEFLLGLSSAGSTLSVSNGGEFAVATFRLGQTASYPNVVNLGKDGTIRAKLLTCEFKNSQNVTFNFDGGRFQSNASSDSYSSLFNDRKTNKWDGVKFYVRKGGAVLDSSNGKHCWWSRPLLCGVEEGETDGGLTAVVMSSKSVVLCDSAVCTYNGPTRVMTTGSTGQFQCRVANALPATTTLQIGPGMTVGFASEWNDSTHIDQTVARVEGVGTVWHNSKLVVTDGISPVFTNAYGTLTFNSLCSISGDYEIVGDANGCGCVKFNKKQDISNLKLKIAAGATLDASKAKGTYYKIVDAPNGYAGTFAVGNLPDQWGVKYTSTAAYITYKKGTVLIFR